MDETSSLNINITRNVTDATDHALMVITASSSMLAYMAILVLSALGAIFPWWSKLLWMPATNLLFLMGTLLATVNFFTNSDGLYTEEYFRIASTALAGIIHPIIGGIAFFQKLHSRRSHSRPFANQPCMQHEASTPTLARQHPSMGLVVGAITICLVAIEAFLVVGYYEPIQKPEEFRTDLDDAAAWLGFVRASICLIQKIVQVFVYILLRRRIVSGGFKASASFYFKALSFYNFVSWLHDIIDLDHLLVLFHEMGSTAADTFIGSAMKTIYKALLIDYRLLCSLLFLEHALEIQETPANGVEFHDGIPLLPLPHSSSVVTQQLQNSDHYFTSDEMTSSNRRKRNAGYLVGVSCLLVRMVYLTSYVPKVHIGPWVHVFAILVYTFLFVCGAILVTKNNLEIRHQSDKESGGIKIMVCCMGAVASTCWIVQAALVGFWAAGGLPDNVTDLEHVCWAAATLSVMAVGTLFLIIVFSKVNVAVITKRNPTVKVNHFLVPAMMLGILSEFVGFAVGQHVGLTQKMIRNLVTEPSLQLLFEAGRAIYLGFCIHLFLYFLVIQCHMGKTRASLDDTGDQPTETSPLLGSL